LQVHLDDERSELHDEELFGLGGLDLYQLLDHELAHVPTDLSLDALPAHAQRVVQRLRQAGALPLAGVGVLEAQKLSHQLQTLLGAALLERQAYPDVAERLLVDLPQAQATPHDLPNVHLQDALSGLLWGEGGALSLTVRASKLANLVPKTPQAYPDKLIDIWLISLAAAAMQQPLPCVVVGRNAVLRVPPQDPEQARAQLQVLLDTWVEGMRWPLPLPPGLALQWLKDKNNRNALADAYEGSDFKRGALGEDPALARTYPTLASLLDTGAFERLAEAVYAPLQAWAADIAIEPLPDADSGDDFEEQA